MALLHIAFVGERTKPIIAAVRELGAEKVYLLGMEDQRETGAEVSGVLDPLGVETAWRSLEGGMLLGAIQAVGELADEHSTRKADLLVNLGAADKGAACAGLSAAFVAGVRAVDFMNDMLVDLPVLHFSYEEVVSENELAVLRALDGLGGEASDLAKLASKAGQPGSNVSYLLRGGKDARGLEPLGLVEIDREAGGAVIRLTPLGRLMAHAMDV